MSIAYLTGPNKKSGIVARCYYTELSGVTDTEIADLTLADGALLYGSDSGSLLFRTDGVVNYIPMMPRLGGWYSGYAVNDTLLHTGIGSWLGDGGNWASTISSSITADTDGVITFPVEGIYQVTVRVHFTGFALANSGDINMSVQSNVGGDYWGFESIDLINSPVGDAFSLAFNKIIQVTSVKNELKVLLTQSTGIAIARAGGGNANNNTTSYIDVQMITASSSLPPLANVYDEEDEE